VGKPALEVYNRTMVAPAKIAVETLGPDLLRLVESAQTGEVVITRGGQPVAKVVPVPPPTKARPIPGYGKGTVLYVSDDFDAPLADFDDET